MSIRVLVNGAKGKIGKEVSIAVDADDELELVARTGRGDDLALKIKESKANVAIDFTHPSVAVKNAETIIDANAHPVIGTTGFKPNDIEYLREKAKLKKLGGIIAPNFAIGSVLMMKYAADAAKYLPQVEIVEYHHDRKADAPSGTAIKTVEYILQTAEIKPPNTVSEEVLPHSLGANVGNIRLHSIRLEGYESSQEVILGGPGQTLKIRHDVINIKSYLPGIILACKKVVKMDKLVYGLEDIL